MCVPASPPPRRSPINVLLLLRAGPGIARVLAAPTAAGEEAPSWRLTALGFLFATLLNPGFVPRIDFAGYAEPALTVTAMVAAWLFIAGQSEVAGSRARSSQLPALCLVLAAMVNAKQSGIGLVAALAG